MTLNLSEIGQTLKRLVSNMAEQNRRWWDVFFDPTPKEINIPQYDENGELITVKIKNLARIKEELKQDQVNIEEVNSIISTEIKQHNADINSHPDIRDLLSRKLEFWKKEPRNPTPDDIPPFENSLWLNTETGEIFVFIKKDKYGASWKGQRGTITSPATPVTMYIFKDGSCIAFYRFEGNLNDDGGQYNIVDAKNYLFDVGLIGKGLRLKGSTNTYASIPIELVTMDFTVTLWVQPISATDYVSVFSLATPDFSDKVNFMVFIEKTEKISIWTEASNENDYSAKTQIPSPWGKKIFLAIRRTNDYVKATTFLNNEKYEVTTTNYPNYTQNVSAFIGKRTNSSSSTEQDAIYDQLRIFNRILTDEEILKLYKLEKQEVL